MQFTITQGDNIATLKQYPDNYFDSIVTDPPYGIEFLGKAWDNNTGAVETWQECFRVLKPGGHLLAFSAARTYHHLATNIESVGFEIRDQLMWIYASGFPKAQDVGKAIHRRGIDNEWAGWKTALKPAHEPIVMARKPFKGSTIDNVLTHGVGALNIDATRIPTDDDYDIRVYANNQNNEKRDTEKTQIEYGEYEIREKPDGRFPSNVLGDIPDYQKYFYCPKVSRAERHCGFEQDQIPDPLANYSQGDVKNHPLWDPSIGTNLQRLKHKILEHNRDLGNKNKDPIATEDKKGNGIDRVCETCGASILRPQECKCPTKSWVRPIKTGNNHPTVKPVELMKYLIKLVTPPNSKVLDPFCGSGSTGMAAVELGHEFVGCELDSAYVKIAETRIRAWNTQNSTGTTYELLFEEQL